MLGFSGKLVFHSTRGAKMAREKEESEELVQLGFRVPVHIKAWLVREAATRTLKTGKRTSESDLIREILSAAEKKSTRASK